MARLAVRLLGPFHVSLDQAPAIGFESDKVRALLAYLAVESERSHRREKLAGLLWSDWPEQSARINLSRALANLRQSIADTETERPTLDVTRQTIQFHLHSDAWVDVSAFLHLVGGGRIRGQTVEQLAEAVDLVRGSFLEGFTLKDCPEFEEWLLLQREHLGRLRMEALSRLAECFLARGDYESAAAYAWKQVEADPLQEGAYSQLMTVLATQGKRAAALAQYEALRRVLHEDLGAEPSAATRALYRRILSGEVAPQAEAKGAGVIRGYDLLEQIGEGSLGTVYRAYQPILGREVAIKMIRPEFANQPEFVRRFESEARVVARLEHLHIVPLHDYWREPDGAYLVMRLFPAGSLQKALDRGPWSLEATARLLDQVASALEAAHQRGVVHGDVKPANILLDETGNAYLSDFCIARDAGASLDPSAPVLSVSPEYAAPEQWQRETVAPQADLYSLGMVLFSLLTGTHPFSGSTPQELRGRHLHEPVPAVTSLRPDIPSSVDQVLCRATAKPPQDRYSDAISLAQAFRRAMGPTGVRSLAAAETIQTVPHNPFKGLRPFDEADAPYFCGRDATVKRLLDRLAVRPDDQIVGASEDGRGRRFLAVVGPSGSGKSSLVRAGLIPALRNGALPGSESWFVTVMQPGVAPLDEMEGALLRVAVRGAEGLREVLRTGEGGLLQAADLILPEAGAGVAHCELLLVVDQLEELYAPEVEPEERERFLWLLYGSVTATVSRVRVIITLRADSFDRPLQHPHLGQLMRERTEVALPLTPDELTQAICGPSHLVGVEPEAGLTAAIVADVAEQPGALPMFQYALTELFERRQDRRLTWEAYRSIGGVAGALAQTAEAVYRGLDATAQSVARQLFLRLVKPGSGTEDKRRADLAELQSIETSSPGPALEPLNAVLSAFGRARLLLFDRDPATRAPTVEIAHEALLRAWRRLREWLEESWADLRMERLLGAATAEWVEAGRDADYLLAGTRLAQFDGWATSSKLALTRDERTFLEASLVDRRAREAEEEARREHELAAARALAEEQYRRAEAEQQRATEQSRSARRLRRRAIYLAAALLGAVLLAVSAALLGLQASRNAELAATREAEALANADLAAANEARAVAQADLAATRQAEASSEAKHRATAEADAIQKRTEAEQQREVAREQARLASARELAAASRATLETDPELSALLALQAVSTAETSEGTNALHQVLPQLRLVRTFSGHVGPSTSVTVDATHSRLATAGVDGTVRLWDLASGRELGQLSFPAVPSAIAFSPDGTSLAVGTSDGATGVWLVPASEPIEPQRTWSSSVHTGTIQDVAFSRDGSRLATAGADATARVWDSGSGQELLSLTAHITGTSVSEPPLLGVTAVIFSPDGNQLLTAGADARIVVWDAANGGQQLELEAHRRPVVSMDLSPDGTRLVTTAEDGRLMLWDLEPGPNQGGLIYSHAVRGNNVAFGPDGTRLAVLTASGETWLLDAADGQEVTAIAGYRGWWGLAFTPEGDGLITTCEDGAARLLDVSPAKELLALKGTSAGAQFGEDGVLATGGPGGAIVWDVSSALNVGVTEPLEAVSGRSICATNAPRGRKLGVVRGVALSPDRRVVATAGTNGSILLWDAATCQELLALVGHGRPVWDVDFAPSGALLASAGADGAIKLWDTTSARLLVSVSGNAEVTGVDISQDGAWLASSSWDRTVSLWDLDLLLESSAPSTLPAESQDAAGPSTVSPTTLFQFDHRVNDVVFSPDGTRLAAAEQSGVVTVWRLSPAQDTAGPASAVWRTFSANNWRIMRLAFSPDGARLATTGGDGATRIWDLESGQEVLTLSLHTSFVTGIAFSPDGRFLTTTGADHVTQLHALALPDLVALARQRLTRSLTDEECRRYLHQEQCVGSP